MHYPASPRLGFSAVCDRHASAALPIEVGARSDRGSSTRTSRQSPLRDRGNARGSSGRAALRLGRAGIRDRSPAARERADLASGPTASPRNAAGSGRSPAAQAASNLSANASIRFHSASGKPPSSAPCAAGHDESSSCHINRMRVSLRSTVRTEVPSCSAISSLEWPSSLCTAIERSVGSSSFSSSRS